MELSTVAAAVASASAAARMQGPFSTPRAVSIPVSWNSPSLASTSRRCLSTSSRRQRLRRWLPVTSAAVELREAAAGGGDSLRVTETPQPGSSVKFSVEVPTSIIHECYQTTLQEYAKRFKVSIAVKNWLQTRTSTPIRSKFLNALVPLLSEVDYVANVWHSKAF